MFIVTSSTQSLYLSLREKWVEYQDICCEVVSSSDWEAVCKHPQQHGCLDKIDHDKIDEVIPPIENQKVIRMEDSEVYETLFWEGKLYILPDLKVGRRDTNEQ